jgi:2-oxoisovalerate dehydrogenase E1 component
MTAAEVADLYESTRRRISALGADVVTRPVLTSAEEVIAPLAPHSPEAVAAEAARVPSADARRASFGGDQRLPEAEKPRHLAVLLNQALHDALAKYPETLLFGEDVAKKGGVYHVTDGLWDTFGEARVFNTLLDETSILGIAIGAAHLGMLPMPEIQYLAYYHNAEDQIRGEAASLQFFSKGQYRNGMVVRIASLGYQKGFGGHFHNDNSIAALRDVPGVVIAAPSRGDDAVGMLRTALASAKVDGRVVLWLEPIALYMTKDLHEDNDGGWLCRYPDPGVAVPFGKARVWPCEGLARTSPSSPSETERGSSARGPHARTRPWHSRPRHRSALVESARRRHVEGRSRTDGPRSRRRRGAPHGRAFRSGVHPAIVEACPRPPKMARDVGADTYIPLGNAWKYCLPSEASIVAKAMALVKG